MMVTEVTPEFVITDELAQKIDRVLDEHDHDATQIVGVLLDVQDLIEQKYVPRPVAFYIAQKLPIKVSVIYDCLTFYNALSETPRAKYPVQVCRSITCKVNDNTDAAVWRGRSRFNATGNDWRFICVGGITGGTALSS